MSINREDWHEDAECAKPANADAVEKFFANKPSQQLEAKKLCNICPVKQDCLTWALDNKQIWGIWGGLDSQKIRNTLSVNWEGQEMRYKKFPLCPNCRTKTANLKTATVDRPDGGRWATMRIVRCDLCKFTWQSRTSANAVDAYHSQKEKNVFNIKNKED
jgi:hypothetical protein